MSLLQAAIYARVSSAQQVGAQTIASQVAALQARVAAEGLPLPDALQFVDAGYSGAVSVLSAAPYGYRYIGKADGGGAARYEIVLEEARVVRQIFRWVGQERATIGAVCRRLTDAGTLTRRGKTVWDRTTVWGLLK